MGGLRACCESRRWASYTITIHFDFTVLVSLKNMKCNESQFHSGRVIFGRSVRRESRRNFVLPTRQSELSCDAKIDRHYLLSATVKANMHKLFLF